MTQRIFDVEHKKDYADLWNIVSDEVVKIKKQDYEEYGLSLKYYDNKGNLISVTSIIAINWHDKTEITRPIQEATEQDIGKICAFWDSTDELINYGVLQSIGSGKYFLSRNEYPYLESYHHCRRLTKQEIEELCR